MSPGNDDVFQSIFSGVEQHFGTSPAPPPRELTDNILGKGDTIDVSGADMMRRGSTVSELPLQPTNQATMECLRGPCIHLWDMTARYPAMSDKLRIMKIRQCNCHTEPTNLTEQNVYHCRQWWPTFLAWVPVSLRAILRARLRRVWEDRLKAAGYDFSWKTWRDDAFETDRRELRGDGALGAHREHTAVDRLPRDNGDKRKGLFFNT